MKDEVGGMKWLDGMCFRRMRDGKVEMEGTGGTATEVSQMPGRLKAPAHMQVKTDADLVHVILF